MKEAVKIFCAFKGQKKNKAISIARLGNSKKGGVLHQALKNTKHLLTENKQNTHAAVPSK